MVIRHFFASLDGGAPPHGTYPPESLLVVGERRHIPGILDCAAALQCSAGQSTNPHPGPAPSMTGLLTILSLDVTSYERLEGLLCRIARNRNFAQRATTDKLP